MEISNTLYVTNRKAWRSWLARNHDKAKDIWLVYYRREIGKPRVPYNDAVEEALCFGWIDSTVKKLDEERFAQRFSPRKKGSDLSQANRERVLKLIQQGKMTPAGLEVIAGVFQPEDSKQQFVIAPDILGLLQANEDAWNNFQKMPEAYRRIRIAYIDSRRRHGREQFEKSLRHFIIMTARGRQFGVVKL